MSKGTKKKQKMCGEEKKMYFCSGNSNPGVLDNPL